MEVIELLESAVILAASDPLEDIPGGDGDAGSQNTNTGNSGWYDDF